MSALPPKADMCSATQHVCFVPIADMARGIRVNKNPRSRGDAHPVPRAAVPRGGTRFVLDKHRVRGLVAPGFARTARLLGSATALANAPAASRCGHGPAVRRSRDAESRGLPWNPPALSGLSGPVVAIRSSFDTFSPRWREHCPTGNGGKPRRPDRSASVSHRRECLHCRRRTPSPSSARTISSGPSSRPANRLFPCAASTFSDLMEQGCRLSSVTRGLQRLRRRTNWISG